MRAPPDVQPLTLEQMRLVRRAASMDAHRESVVRAAQSARDALAEMEKFIRNRQAEIITFTRMYEVQREKVAFYEQVLAEVQA